MSAFTVSYMRLDDGTTWTRVCSHSGNSCVANKGKTLRIPIQALSFPTHSPCTSFVVYYPIPFSEEIGLLQRRRTLHFLRVFVCIASNATIYSAWKFNRPGVDSSIVCNLGVLTWKKNWQVNWHYFPTLCLTITTVICHPHKYHNYRMKVTKVVSYF